MKLAGESFNGDCTMSGNGLRGKRTSAHDWGGRVLPPGRKLSVGPSDGRCPKDP